VIDVASEAGLVVTVEEHAPFGGLGSMVCQVVSRNCPKKVISVKNKKLIGKKSVP